MIMPAGGSEPSVATEDELISLEYRAENGAARLNNFMGRLLLEDAGWAIYWRASIGLIVYYDKIGKTISNLDDLDGLRAYVAADTCEQVRALLPAVRNRYNETI